MSDFRVSLSPDDEYSTRELDWNETSHQWRLSDIERGSVTWEMDRNPTESALEGLRDFFEIPGDFSLATLTRLSPGELAAIHSQSHEPLRIRAIRCNACGQHWIVYKLSSTTWQKFGRKEGNKGWWLGSPVSDGEALSAAGTRARRFNNHHV